jgi:hypothetical protein
LGTKKFLPTSSGKKIFFLIKDKSCTSVILEIHYKENFGAKIEFLTIQEWEIERKNLILQIENENTTEEIREIAIQQLDAIFGKSNWKKDEELPTEIYKLISTNNIIEFNSKKENEIGDLILKYVSNRVIIKIKYK